MSRKSEEEIQAIMEEYRDAPMVNPDKVYPPLPPVQNVTPLVRVPEQMSFTENVIMTGIGVAMTEHSRPQKNYRFKALKFEDRYGTLYLHFTIPCLLSERRTL